MKPNSPNPLDVAAIRAAEARLDVADRALNGARDALSIAGALSTRRASDSPLPKMSSRLTAYRDQLVAGGMASEIAEINIDLLLQKGRALQVREAELRVALAEIDADIASYHEATRRQIAPLEAEVDRLSTATTAAVERLDKTRIARESELTETLGKRRHEIIFELQTPHRPQFRIDGWAAPKPGDEPIAPVKFPGQS
jgi:hypothetical protein